MEAVGNITNEAVRKYIKEQAEESRKKIQEVPLCKWTSNSACGTALWSEQ